MNKEYYQPNDNYERNLIMVKKFGGSFTVFMLPVFMLISIVLSCYITLFMGEQPLEHYLIQVANSKLGIRFEFGTYNMLISLVRILISVFLIYSILYIFFKSKNQSMQSNPDFGYSLIHTVTKIILLISVLLAVFLIVNTAVFIFGDVSRYEGIGKKLNLTLSQLKAYKVSISILFILIDILACVFVWYAQAQADFIKSIRLSLIESLPKNKGAHIYGVISVIIGIAMLCFSGGCSYMYYCYRDAFTGFGISIETNYVYLSLVLSFVKGMIPLALGINAIGYSSLVDETNTYGTLYNQYTVIGSAVDPNMTDRKINY